MENLFRDILTTLQDMQVDTRALAHDLDMMKSRVNHLDESLTKLTGTFASIEQIFLDHEKRIQALEKRPPAA